jgi:hypothetical protein
LRRLISEIGFDVEWIYSNSWLLIEISCLIPVVMALLIPFKNRKFMLFIALMLHFPVWATGWMIFMWAACFTGYCL